MGRAGETPLWIRALTWVVVAVCLTGGVLQGRACAICIPKAGKWTPWTGTVCYGEKP